MKRRNERKLTKREEFESEFAEELDIFDSTLDIPDWYYARREELLGKLGRREMAIYRVLKDLGLKFKIKWPLEIDGKWKYADAFFPKQRTVLVVTNPTNDFRPLGLPGERAEFFNDRYRVVEVEDVDDLRRKMEIKSKTRNVC